jgi:hypothetical protein
MRMMYSADCEIFINKDDALIAAEKPILIASSAIYLQSMPYLSELLTILVP